MTEERNSKNVRKYGTNMDKLIVGILWLGLPVVLSMAMAFTVPKIQQAHRELDPIVVQTADSDHNSELSYEEIRDVYETIGRNSYSIGELVLTLPEKVDYLERKGVEHDITLPLPRGLLNDNYPYEPKIGLSILAKCDFGTSLDDTIR